jgi:large repetitive protein
MVSAVQFAVRDSAGGRQLGKVAGDEQGNFIQVGTGDSISLNISPSNVIGYEQQGRDLVIKLADGRVIVLAGYFDGGDHHLYLSADGTIAEVHLEGGSDGVLAANYGPAQGWDKWSPLDDLRFAEADGILDNVAAVDEPAGMGIFAPALLAGGSGLGAAAAGLGGLALLGGSSGGGNGGDTTPGGGDTTPGGGDTAPHRAAPTVDDPDGQGTLTTNTENPVIVVTGTGEPGDTVTVSAGDSTETTTIGSDGTWGVEFVDPNLPPDGTYSTEVVVTQPDGTETLLDGPNYIIDMTPPAVDVTEGTVGAGDLENLVDYEDGVTIAGTGEAGATVAVEIEGTTHGVTVGSDGTWSVTFTQTEVAGGERTVDVTITATDPLGNQTVVNDTLALDTIPYPVAINSVTSDNTVSQSEFNEGFAITGTTAAGAVITLQIAGSTSTTTAGADGTWSVGFPPGSIAGGTYTATVTASTVDAAGNASSTSATFQVDTEVTVSFAPDPIAGDNIVNMMEATGGVTMTGSSQAGSSVSVEWGGRTLAATTAADGSWSVTFPGAQIPADGATVATVTATDSVGNTTSATRAITVDTSTAVTINAPLVGDDIISGAERTAGFALTGTAEPGATVVVEFGGTSKTVTADAGGSWTATYAAGSIPGGFYEAAVNVTATDVAGNIATTGRVISVDTETNVAVGANQAGDDVISGAERNAGVTLTGTAEPGALVQVTMGTATHTVTASSAGTWSVVFATSEIPSGTSDATVSVTATDVLGNTASATHAIKIDTEVVPLTRGSLSAGSDEVINQTEAARGLTITGTVEAGSTVMVQFGLGAPVAATVASNGAWSVAIPLGHIPQGETGSNLTVVATDAYGNSRTHTETVQVDRLVRNFGPADPQLSGDGYLNAEEAQQGLVVNGTAEPGATVVVQIAGGGTMTVTTGSNGLWSTTFSGANLPRGEVETSVTVTATDRAGNVASYSQPLIIDTIAPGAPNVETFTRNTVGLTRIQTDETSESYDFVRIDANGHVSHIDAVRSVDDVFGTQNVSFGSYNGAGGFSSTPVPDGSYLVVNTTDLAGNESSTLLVVNNTNAPEIDLGRAGLSGFDFSAIDLTFAPDANLTISEAQILNITGADKTLVIKGAEDDHVAIVEGTSTGHTQEIDGEIYNIYTVGHSGATILLDDDITVI